VVGKWVRAAAGKAKAGIVHSTCRWNARYAVKSMLSLDSVCYTRTP